MSTECAHSWERFSDKIIKCSKCRNFKYDNNGKSFLQKLDDSITNTIADMKQDDWGRKVFNFIKNDFAGILNSFNDERISFEYNDSFLDKGFLQKIVEILKRVSFKEQRYDKKTLREELMALFSDMLIYESFVIGERQRTGIIVPLTDREFVLYSYITSHYD